MFETGTAFAGLVFLLVFLKKGAPLRTKLESEFCIVSNDVKMAEKVVDSGREFAAGREPEKLEIKNTQ